jgi:VWFA-related protein
MRFARMYCGFNILSGLLLTASLPAQQPAYSVPTFRTQSNLVVVDVVVTDGHNRPVDPLAAGDFTLLEDGKQQTIKAFEAHLPQTVAAPPTPKLAPGTFTNRLAVADGGPLNVILLDKLNTPTKDQPTLNDQLVQYLKEARPGQRVAIFGLGTRLYLLQGFTSDPKQLLSFLQSKKALPSTSPLLDGVEEGTDNLAVDTLEDEAYAGNLNAADMLEHLRQFIADQQAFQQQLRVRYTLDGFNALARYLANLPGRKNLLWFSGSFPLSILPDGDLKYPFANVSDAEDEFRQTVDLLTRSQVAVYPVDARGLQVAPMMNAANSGRSYAHHATTYSRDLNKFSSRLAAEQSTMRQMAEATGGEAFVNTNGLKEATEKALELGAHYYTLAYAPTNAHWHGEFRHIKVALDRPGLTLAYRRGYYADDPAAEAGQHHSAAAKDAPAAYDPVRTAMMHGAPNPTEILFDAEVHPASEAVEPQPVAGNRADPKIKGPFRRYLVTIHAEMSGLRCTDLPQNQHQCRIEFATNVYDADGAQINQQLNGVQVTLPEAKYLALLRSRIGYHQQISVPAKGTYFLRIAVHDTTSGHIGALELPVAAVAKLPVVSAPMASPAH